METCEEDQKPNIWPRALQNLPSVKATGYVPSCYVSPRSVAAEKLMSITGVSVPTTEFQFQRPAGQSRPNITANNVRGKPEMFSSRRMKSDSSSMRQRSLPSSSGQATDAGNWDVLASGSCADSAEISRHVSVPKVKEEPKDDHEKESFPVFNIMKPAGNDQVSNALALICPRIRGRNSVSDRDRVRNARMIYDALRRKLFQNGVNRTDLTAGSLMKNNGFFLNRGSEIVGSIPGVNVGDIFFYRMEMMVMGLHAQSMAGIDFINTKDSPWQEPVAVSVISSGLYEDDEDCGGNKFIYTGQGGKIFQIDGKHIGHQKLTRGNLALEKSMHHDVQVRVIRGFRGVPGPSGKIHVYDGLYYVNKGWLDRGRSGFDVFKYELGRVAGQKDLGSAVLKKCSHWIQYPRSRKNLLNPDLSGGKEHVPVIVVNDTGDGAVIEGFQYSKEAVLHTGGSLQKKGPKAARPCQCHDGCHDQSCSCICINGGEVPYNPDMCLVRTMNMIFECGDLCNCPADCPNRVTQKGMHKHLEVFRTQDSRWGVRSWDAIPAGSFICEYTGQVFAGGLSIRYKESQENGYFISVDSSMEENPHINFDNLYHIFGLSGGPQMDSASSIKLDIVIDATETGNVSRFINHSCCPNLVRQCVVYENHDTRFPHVMLFAIENIAPMTELTFDHGKRNSDQSLAGIMRKCSCGVDGCRRSF